MGLAVDREPVPQPLADVDGDSSTCWVAAQEVTREDQREGLGLRPRCRWASTCTVFFMVSVATTLLLSPTV